MGKKQKARELAAFNEIAVKDVPMAANMWKPLSNCAVITGSIGTLYTRASFDDTYEYLSRIVQEVGGAPNFVLFDVVGTNWGDQPSQVLVKWDDVLAVQNLEQPYDTVVPTKVVDLAPGQYRDEDE